MVILLFAVIVDMMETRTIEAQIVQKLKNNKPRPIFTDSYKQKRVWILISHCKQLRWTPVELNQHYRYL